MVGGDSTQERFQGIDAQGVLKAIESLGYIYAIPYGISLTGTRLEFGFKRTICVRLKVW